MALFTIWEFLDLIIMTGVIGFIFKDYFRPRAPYDPLAALNRGFDYQAFRFAVLVTVPAIALHELAHKFVALSFGLTATFHADYIGLLLGLALKLIHFPFIFFVPAFVSIHGTAGNLAIGLSALAGPLTNLLLLLICTALLKFSLVKPRYQPLLILTRQINMLLFILNMLPLPGFDGNTFYAAMFRLFSG